MAIAAEIDLGHFAAWIDDLGESLKNIDLTPLMKAISLALEGGTKRLFDKGESPDGKKWAPLKNQRNRPRDKRARGGDQKPLRDRGLLMASLSASGQAHVERITSSALEWGTNLEYAAVHQFGHTFERTSAFGRETKPYRQTVPARPFLGLSPEIENDIGLMVLEFVGEQFASGAAV